MSLNVSLLRESFQLVAERQPDLAVQFYETLFTRHPEAQKLFTRERDAQAKMLTEALVAVLDHLEDAPWLETTLGKMGVDHVGYGVTAEMYPWVAKCMMATLSDVAADDWTPDLNEAWGEALGAVAGLMLAGADSA